jgi:alpha-L-fucosidase
MSVEIRRATGDASWFIHHRFGLFIHWGLYALPARHEWVKSYECMTDEEYQKYFDHFAPDLYDPHAWARAARDAGMKSSACGTPGTPTTRRRTRRAARTS